jgi:hypothetical protein
MIGLDSNYPTNVKYVNKKTTATGKPYTTFSISDQVKNGTGGKKYKYYTVTVWDEHLDLQDGDKVIFKSITGLNSYEDKNGYVKDCFSATVEVVKSDAPQFATDEPPKFYEPPIATPQFTTPRQSTENFFKTDDDTSLPWDLN